MFGFKRRMKARKDTYFWRINIEVIPEEEVTGGYADMSPDRWTWTVDGPICRVKDDPYLMDHQSFNKLPQYHKEGSAATWKEAERTAERVAKFLAKLANDPYLGHGYTHEA